VNTSLFQELAWDVFLQKQGCQLGYINTATLATATPTCTAYNTYTLDFTITAPTAINSYNIFVNGVCSTIVPVMEANNSRVCNPVAYTVTVLTTVGTLPAYLTKSNIPTGDTTHWMYTCSNASLVLDMVVNPNVPGSNLATT